MVKRLALLFLLTPVLANANPLKGNINLLEGR